MRALLTSSTLQHIAFLVTPKLLLTPPQKIQVASGSGTLEQMAKVSHERAVFTAWRSGIGSQPPCDVSTSWFRAVLCSSLQPTTPILPTVQNACPNVHRCPKSQRNCNLTTTSVLRRVTRRNARLSQALAHTRCADKRDLVMARR